MSRHAKIASPVTDVKMPRAIAHNSALAHACTRGTAGAGKRRVKAKAELLLRQAGGQTVGDDRDVTDAVPFENAADEVIDTIADNGNIHPVIAAKGDEGRKVGIDLDRVEKSVELENGRVDQGNLRPHAFGCGNPAGVPILFQLLPRVTREPLQDKVRYIFKGNGAVEITKCVHNHRAL